MVLLLPFSLLVLHGAAAFWILISYKCCPPIPGATKAAAGSLVSFGFKRLRLVPAVVYSPVV